MGVPGRGNSRRARGPGRRFRTEHRAGQSVPGHARFSARDPAGDRDARSPAQYRGAGRRRPELPAPGGGSGKFVLGAVGTLFGFFIMLFLLFFLFRDGARMVDHMVRLIPMDPQRRRKLVDGLANVARAVVYGTGVTALFQGLMLGIVFAIAGFPAPLVFGVLAGIVSLLPAAGTPLFLGARRHLSRHCSSFWDGDLHGDLGNGDRLGRQHVASDFDRAARTDFGARGCL